jgi:hypothetical protein
MLRRSSDEFSVKAKYLEPQMTSSEFQGAIRNNFSPHIQSLWSTAKLTNLQEAITFLSEMEALEPYEESLGANLGHQNSNTEDQKPMGNPLIYQDSRGRYLHLSQHIQIRNGENRYRKEYRPPTFRQERLMRDQPKEWHRAQDRGSGDIAAL